MAHLSVLCPTQTDDDGRRHRVLIVDACDADREAARQSLENHGIDAVPVADPADVPLVTRELQPAAILLETNLPGTDGYDLCTQLKDDGATANVPVLFFTHETRPEMMLVGFESGASDFIRKGCESVELIARLRTNIEKTELQQRLMKNQRALAEQLKQTHALAEQERMLREQVETQRTQMMQSEKMASIGQLAAGVAHEINNPTGFVASNLNSLRGYIDDLKPVFDAYAALRAAVPAEPSNTLTSPVAAVDRAVAQADLAFILDDLDGLIDESVEGTRRIRQIVADLRDFSHVDSPDLEDCSLNDLLDKTLSVAGNELKYKADVVRAYADVPELRCFGGKLGQVFLNLLVNAAHAIETHGTITVTTGVVTDRPDHVFVEVQDTGKGIAPEHLTRVFDPFFTTKDVGKGTGLGLHLTYTIVTAHEGTISVQSTPGVGTTFRVELPVAGPSTEADTDTSDRLPGEPQAHAA